MVWTAACIKWRLVWSSALSLHSYTETCFAYMFIWDPGGQCCYLWSLKFSNHLVETSTFQTAFSPNATLRISNAYRPLHPHPWLWAACGIGMKRMKGLGALQPCLSDQCPGDCQTRAILCSCCYKYRNIIYVCIEFAMLTSNVLHLAIEQVCVFMPLHWRTK